MPLTYHHATFDLMGKKPQVSQRAVEALAKRERALGITFPASLKEFYSLRGASKILEDHSNEDRAVLVDELGDPAEVERGVLKIQDENQGVGAWYVRLDGSDDPPVVVELEFDRRPPPEDAEEWSWLDLAVFHPLTDHFSEFVYQRVLTYGGGPSDRRAARRLKPYGAYVHFDTDGRAVEARFNDRVDVQGRSQPAERLDDAAMKNLRSLQKLVSLELPSVKADGGSWVHLRDHPGLVGMLDQGSLDDAAVEHLCAMPALRKLQLSDTRLSDEGLERLLRGHQFTVLAFGVGSNLTPRGFAALEAQVGIEKLVLRDGHSPLTDEHLVGVAGLGSLKSLQIVSKHVTDTGLRHIAGLTGLESLQMSLMEVTDAGLEHLAGLTHLKFLQLGWSKHITGAGFRHLANAHGLRKLWLLGLPIVDEALAHFAAFTDLEELNLRETKIVGPGLRFLAGLAKLRGLDLRWDALDDEAMPHLAALPGLQEVDLSGSKITDAGLRALGSSRSLRVLDAERTAISDAAVEQLKAAVPGLGVRWSYEAR